MYHNEDVAFERLKDLQREMENSRMMAGDLATLGSVILKLGERVWWIAGLAMRRPPRRHAIALPERFEEAAESDAA